MRPTLKGLRDRRGKASNTIRNLVRRMLVTASSGAQWALEGFSDGEGNVERDDVEVFSGVGFYSRPIDGSGEVVVVKVGGESGHPVVVATRDQAALAALEAVIGAIGPGETVVFNRSALIWIRSDGQAHVGAIGGTMKRLATEDHKHSLSGVTFGGDPAVGTMGAPDDVTSDLRGS
jgi:phage gp45-like